MSVKVLLSIPEAKPARGLLVLPGLAVLLAGVLLLADLPSVSAEMHNYLSAAPLTLAGVGYAVLQLRLRPARGTLLKRLMLAATFVLWAVDQLLPPGRVATVVGDVVIAAYVLDLYWLTQEQTTPDQTRSDLGQVSDKIARPASASASSRK
jgi:hypothetical protein